ncbi:DUF292 domain protein [Aspergillus steynii IBT 23096]|uniref:DUF292 domain protein n=1 Tax=Aspergillus steynii IBT 23096 TaxID=1392250 RepID=A0A2I2GHD6_9EURO|nr:DUF292 domain protein [Aspergillus steynii IBT 23096]PLB52289.1 DUF292 domain protein [Aspergillus steynii IBT 23096]
MPPSPQTTKLTSTLHLLIPRLRLLQKKSTASSVVQRRELSHILSEGREASARIRVENVIATDISVEVLEMVELYCELILARANVVDQAAFGEKGVLARNRAKEVWSSLRHAQGQGQGQAAGDGKGRGQAQQKSGFSFWNPFGGSSSNKPSGPVGAESPKAETEETLAATDEDLEVLESKYIDPALDEAAAAIFYAYPRFPHDVRELTILRTLLADRWGKDFMALAADNKFPAGEGVKVPARLVKGLRAKPPSTELVESYLLEIARAYGVNWGEHLQGHPDPELGEAPAEFVDGDEAEFKENRDDGTGPGDDEGPGDLPSTPAKLQRRQSDTAELNRVTPPRGLQAGKSPVSVAPPGPRSDNPNPRVKVPGSGSGKETVPETQSPSKSKSGGIPELDELTKRFAALRR